MMNNCKRKYLFFLALVPSIVMGQEIFGTVKDDNGNAVEYANVVLLDSNKGYIGGVTTAVDGNFSFKREQNTVANYLVATYVGMKSDTVRIDSATRMPLNIVLSAEGEALDEVVVKGTRRLFKNENDEITANVENTILAKAGSLDKLMNQIPFVSGAGGSYNVFGRGAAIVYLNNRRVYDENTLKTINSDRIKKVQVVTNPGARYAADIKAVIRIYTKDNPDGLGGNAYTSLTAGRKFSNNEGASLVCNMGKWQVTAGVGYANYRNRVYSQDETAIIANLAKLYTNNAVLDYDMTYYDGNVGLMYDQGNYSVGLNSRLTQYRHEHELDMRSIDHYTDVTRDFHESGSNASTNKPLQWLTNMFYNVSLGKTRIDITDDLMLGRQRKGMNYSENDNPLDITDEGGNVVTNNKSDYLMNSFVADMSTQIAEQLSLNYGGELTFSRHKQTFGFEEENISTEMTASESKSEQLLGGIFTSMNASFGKFSLDFGLRYEYANWRYFEGNEKRKAQSRIYNNLFPTLNITFNPTEKATLSLGYRQSIARPNYAQLNDNIEYQSRYYYVQGNSMLTPSITNSVNLLASYGNLRLIGSVDFIKDDIAMVRNIYGTGGEIVFSKAENVAHYTRWNAGINWWHGFGIYTPYLELGIGGQDFTFHFDNTTMHFNHPFVNFKVHNTLNFKNNLSVNLFVDYYGKNYSLFRKATEQWQSELSVSKSIGSLFVQLSLNNMLCPRTRTSVTYCNEIIDVSYSNNDNRSVSLFLSYTFNYKQKKRNLGTKTSEVYRF